MNKQILKLVNSEEGTLKINPYFELVREKGINFLGLEVDKLTIKCNLLNYTTCYKDIDLTNEKINSDLIDYIEFEIYHFIDKAMYEASQELRKKFKAGYFYGS